MNAQEALWSALEVTTQAEQCTGQVDIWEAVREASYDHTRCGSDGWGCAAPVADYDPACNLGDTP